MLTRRTSRLSRRRRSSLGLQQSDLSDLSPITQAAPAPKPWHRRQGSIDSAYDSADPMSPRTPRHRLGSVSPKSVWSKSTPAAVQSGTRQALASELQNQQDLEEAKQEKEREWARAHPKYTMWDGFEMDPGLCADLLEEFYASRDPSKTRNVRVLVDKYAGRERVLLETVARKYAVPTCWLWN
eukprot:TRINITY_DN277_c0_g1_i3.p1 TRINITY_DN277_c0_g1~~TRINITY_DN277_c0_g1_i3.p1  ORF type:complete len:183 (+),score=15.38 TRINITY_DN277_c0_g1_i3:238-786(+)